MSKTRPTLLVLDFLTVIGWDGCEAVLTYYAILNKIFLYGPEPPGFRRTSDFNIKKKNFDRRKIYGERSGPRRII